jgi:hypothetical protein
MFNGSVSCPHACCVHCIPFLNEYYMAALASCALCPHNLRTFCYNSIKRGGFSAELLAGSAHYPALHCPSLKVPKREIFDRSDFPDFYTIKSLRVGDFGVKIKKN